MRLRSPWGIAWAVGSLGLLGMSLGVLRGAGPGDGLFITLIAPTSVALGVRPDAEENALMRVVVQTERGRVLWWTNPNVRYSLEFLRPVGVALDETGRLWVGDDALNAVFSISVRGRHLDFRC
ncbi:MAG: hypothetical protein NZ742_05395 [Acidobacteria bacterium]|nr:hypothetical protein [Acidobacteriota bacterium]MDW7984496.1 hypothetical protein [Acidobacteriota bacterium]